MPRHQNIQFDNFQIPIADLAKQIRKQEKFFHDQKRLWEELTEDLILEVGVDVGQVIPEFQSALGHIQKGINVQHAYHAKLQANKAVLEDIDGEIANKNEEELEEMKRQVDAEFSKEEKIHEERTKGIEEHWDKNSFMSGWQQAKNYCDRVFNKSSNQDADDDMEVDMEGAAKIPDRCPLTQKPYETPVPITACTRTCIFEKLAIKEYVTQKMNAARDQGRDIGCRCPNPGCQTFITNLGMIDDSRMMSAMLKTHIKNQ